MRALNHRLRIQINFLVATSTRKGRQWINPDVFPENTNIIVDQRTRRGSGGCSGSAASGDETDGARGRGGGRRERNREDESRWKGRKHEAGMTSLGLTFHSRPTPALCILTSPRCVSYILYLSSFPPIPSLAFLPSSHCSAGFFRERKGRKKWREGDAHRASPSPSHPISWTKGLLAAG